MRRRAGVCGWALDAGRARVGLEELEAAGCRLADGREGAKARARRVGQDGRPAQGTGKATLSDAEGDARAGGDTEARAVAVGQARAAAVGCVRAAEAMRLLLPSARAGDERPSGEARLKRSPGRARNFSEAGLGEGGSKLGGKPEGGCGDEGELAKRAACAHGVGRRRRIASATSQSRDPRRQAGGRTRRTYLGRGSPCYAATAERDDEGVRLEGRGDELLAAGWLGRARARGRRRCSEAKGRGARWPAFEPSPPSHPATPSSSPASLPLALLRPHARQSAPYAPSRPACPKRRRQRVACSPARPAPTACASQVRPSERLTSTVAAASSPHGSSRPPG